MKGTMKGKMGAKRWFWAVLWAGLAVLAACGEESKEEPQGEVTPSAGDELVSDKQRIENPNVPSADLETLTADNAAFAVDLYQEVREGDGNLFFSPHSISIALAMTYGGARGETATEMEEVLHYSLGQEALHPAFNALDQALSSRGEGVVLPEAQEGDPFRLSVVNAIWGQRGYPFLSDYLDLLALNYGAGLRVLDFAQEPEPSREAINAWVEDQTEERIKDLLPQGAIGSDTRLVLTNAVYFKASWLHPFEPSATQDGEFTKLDGQAVTVPLMKASESFGFFHGEGFAAAELPYVGEELSMVVILPDEGGFEGFEAGLSAEGLAEIVGGLQRQPVDVTLPKFTFEHDLPLTQPLQEMGMRSAFEAADFSGMDGTRSLVITDVLHKAFVAVDEKGTEAAAATAVVVGKTSAPPPSVSFTVDRPFLFLIRDIQTGAILFLGRVVDPS